LLAFELIAAKSLSVLALCAKFATVSILREMTKDMMKHLLLGIVCIFLSAGSMPVFAQAAFNSLPAVIPSEESEPEAVEAPVLHPIDREVNELLDKQMDTHGQIQALGRGIELWDAELNRVYKELVKAYGNNEKAKAKLKAAQLAWIKFRDAEYDHLFEMYQLKDGTMYRIFQTSDRMEIIKARALELKSRLDTFNDAK